MVGYVDSPLSYIDSHASINLTSIAVSFVLDLFRQDAVALDRIKSAAEAVAHKWRWMAGRIVWDEPSDRYLVRVPTGDIPSEYALVELSSETHGGACPIELPTLSGTKCVPVPVLPDELAVSPARELSLAELAASQRPLVGIHVSLYEDRQVVGFCIPHCIVDMKGFAIWLDAFSCELNRSGEWEAPPVPASNRLDEAFARIARETDGDPLAEPSSAYGPDGLSYGAKECTWWNEAILRKANWLDESWYGMEAGGAFLGQEVVEWLVKRVKENVRKETDGKEFVSTGDILQGWIMKAGLADEPSDATVNVTNILCIRDVLGLTSPPTPNWTLTGALTSLFPSPSSSALSTLALYNRRWLARVRTPAHLSAWFKWFSSFRHSKEPIIFQVGADAWFFSNHTACGASQAVDWGSGRGNGYEYRAKLVPGPFQKSLMLNRVEKGWLWTGKMRTSRWASVRRELEKLENEYNESQAIR